MKGAVPDAEGATPAPETPAEKPATQPAPSFSVPLLLFCMVALVGSSVYLGSRLVRPGMSEAEVAALVPAGPSAEELRQVRLEATYDALIPMIASTFEGSSSDERYSMLSQIMMMDVPSSRGQSHQALISYMTSYNEAKDAPFWSEHAAMNRVRPLYTNWQAAYYQGR